jgi:hypothetical protein
VLTEEKFNEIGIPQMLYTAGQDFKKINTKLLKLKSLKTTEVHEFQQCDLANREYFCN